MNPKAFQKLQAQWYKKLKHNGFEDIEQPDGNLTSWSGKRASTDAASQAEYYHWAQQCLYDKKFPSALDKKIWALHASGATYDDLVSQIPLSRLPIQRRIQIMKKLFSNIGTQE